MSHRKLLVTFLALLVLSIATQAQTDGTAELKRRAEVFAQRMGHTASPVPLSSVVGGGSAPETYLPSWGVALEFPGMSVSEIEETLRRSDPPVIVRVEDGHVVLDFRTIFASEEEELLTIIRGLSLRT